MKISHIILLGLSVAVAGCDKKPKPASITADELLLAQGGQVFTVITPNTVDPEAFAGLALKHADGKISPFSSSTGLKANQELKIVIFDPKAGSLRFAILGEGYTQRGESANFPSFGMRASNPKSTRLEAGQTLIRFSPGNSVSLPPAELADGAFELIFHIQKSKSEQGADGNPH
jgi:hypothetical protein